MSETMEIGEAEEESNSDNNSQDLLPNMNTVNSSNSVIVIESDDSDVTYVDQNDINNANILAITEAHNSVTNEPNTTNLTSSELSQKSTSSLNNTDLSSSTSPSKKRRYSEVPIEEDDSQSCPICLDDWTTSGDHRLCSLNCGHLFGYNCIKRWLDSESQSSCPTCKKKTRQLDIRFIYARKVIAVDTTELTITKRKLENVTEQKNRFQMELSKATFRIQTLTDQVADYKNKLTEMTYANQVRKDYRLVNSHSSTEIVYLYKEKTVDLGKNSSCRVFDCKGHLDLAGISMKSPNNLYAGYGIKILNLNNFKPTSFITLHAQPIRDVKFHETEPWLLSCSIDKKIKILDVNSNSVITTFDSSSPLWSCCWDIKNDRMLYVGQQQGSVLKYDMRGPSTPLSVMSIDRDYSPVVSVQAVKPSCSETPSEAVISCKLNCAWHFETPLVNETQVHVQTPLSFEGPLVSMIYQKENDHLFLSSRPNTKCPFGRHFLCALNKRGDNISCDIVHTFRGSSTQKMLSRTCFLSNKNDYAAAYIEDQQIVSLWNINTGNKVGYIAAHDCVFDLNSVKKNCDDFLLCLTESKLEFFKFANYC